MNKLKKFVSFAAALCILSAAAYAEIGEIPQNSENVNYVNLENSASYFSADIQLIYQNEYHEAVLMPNDTLTVSVTISNSTTQRELVCALAEYDSVGRLLTLTAEQPISAPAEETVEVNLTKTFSDLNIASAKIFLWEKSTLNPLQTAFF